MEIEKEIMAKKKNGNLWDIISSEMECYAEECEEDCDDLCDMMDYKQEEFKIQRRSSPMAASLSLFALPSFDQIQ